MFGLRRKRIKTHFERYLRLRMPLKQRQNLAVDDFEQTWIQSIFLFKKLGYIQLSKKTRKYEFRALFKAGGAPPTEAELPRWRLQSNFWMQPIFSLKSEVMFGSQRKREKMHSERHLRPGVLLQQRLYLPVEVYKRLWNTLDIFLQKVRLRLVYKEDE